MENKLKEYTKKYKEYILPISLIVLSLFILLFVVLPQFGAISDLNQQIKKAQTNIEILNNSLTTLNVFDEVQLDSQLNTATAALPNGKEIAKIFSALSSTSSEVGVVLTGFSLQVGDIYTTEGTARELPVVAGVPALDVNVKVSADNVVPVINFGKELQEKLPLAEIKTLEFAANQATYEVNFYYKAYNLTAISKQDRILPLSNQEKETLETIQEWSP